MKKTALTIFALLGTFLSWGQLSVLRPDLERITDGKNMEVGIALRDLSTGETLMLNNHQRYPMQSVFKLHLAVAVLNAVDALRWQLDDSIRFQPDELYTHLWSPIQKKYAPDQAVLTLSEIIRYTVQQSDNSGCDKLLALIGGPDSVTSFLHAKGINDVQIVNNEAELQSSWERQFQNWTTLEAAIQLLQYIYEGRLLKPESHQFLWQTLLGTSTGSIRKYLPEHAQIAYKTGFSGRNPEGVTAANNNIGILILPNKHPIAYAIFITKSTETQELNYHVIGQLASAIYQGLAK